MPTVLNLFNGEGTHLDSREAVNSSLVSLDNNKVEKVAGKSLSDVNFSQGDKDALDNVVLNGGGTGSNDPLKVNVSDVVDVLDSTSATNPLSGNMGRVLNEALDALVSYVTINDTDTNVNSLQDLFNIVRELDLATDQNTLKLLTNNVLYNNLTDLVAAFELVRVRQTEIDDVVFVAPETDGSTPFSNLNNIVAYIKATRAIADNANGGSGWDYIDAEDSAYDTPTGVVNKIKGIISSHEVFSESDTTLYDTFQELVTKVLSIDSKVTSSLSEYDTLQEVAAAVTALKTFTGIVHDANGGLSGTGNTSLIDLVRQPVQHIGLTGNDGYTAQVSHSGAELQLEGNASLLTIDATVLTDGVVFKVVNTTTNTITFNVLNFDTVFVRNGGEELTTVAVGDRYSMPPNSTALVTVTDNGGTYLNITPIGSGSGEGVGGVVVTTPVTGGGVLQVAPVINEIQDGAAYTLPAAASVGDVNTFVHIKVLDSVLRPTITAETGDSINTDTVIQIMGACEFKVTSDLVTSWRV